MWRLSQQSGGILMSAFKNRTASKLVRKIKTLLNLDARGVRGVVSGKTAQQQIASKDGEIVALRRELSRVRGVETLPDFAKEGTPIFFVVGHHKSGTTWLMEMLNSHPEILCQGEGRPFGRNWRQEHLKQRRESYPPTSLYNAVLSSEDLKYW